MAQLVGVFFFPRVADVALKARFLHEHKLARHLYKANHVHLSRQIDEKNTQPPNPTKYDDPPLQAVLQGAPLECTSEAHCSTVWSIFSSNAFMASVKSFNMFQSMLQLGLMTAAQSGPWHRLATHRPSRIDAAPQ